MTLSWAFSDPSPGNTIYTINVYQATDDKGTEFILTKFLKTLGKSKCFLLLCITKLTLALIQGQKTEVAQISNQNKRRSRILYFIQSLIFNVS